MSMSWTTSWRSCATVCSVSLRGGRRRLERGDGQQLVDRRRLRCLLREPVALRQRGHFVGADALDQAVVLFPDPRLGSRAARPFQEDFQGSIEMRSLPSRDDRPRALSGRFRNAAPTGRSDRRPDRTWELEPEQVFAGTAATAGAGCGAGAGFAGSTRRREQRDEAHPPRQAATSSRHGVSVL